MIKSYGIDNSKMLNLFSFKDEIAYFYDCLYIEMAGKENFNIKKVEYYAENEEDILSSYARIVTYYDDSITVSVHSDSMVFIESIAEYLLHHSAQEIDITSRVVNLDEIASFKNRFTFLSSEEAAPTYGFYEKNLSERCSLPNGVELIIADSEFYNRVKNNLEMLSYMKGYQFDDLFNQANGFSDTIIYCMMKDNKLIGYLRAECGYKNYYDIGWVEIASDFQKQGLGKQIVLFFMEHCFQNKRVPHYGYALSKESVALACATGYTQTYPAKKWIKIRKNN